MVVTVKRTRVDDWGFEYGEQQEMTIDGKTVAHVGGGEPEDNRIGRDLFSCLDIAVLMKRAYDAGKAGEEWDLVVTAMKDAE